MDGRRLGEGEAESGEVVPASWTAMLVENRALEHSRCDGNWLASNSVASPGASDDQR